MPEILKSCPRCGGNDLYRYHKVNDCVKCKRCGYFNTEENWNEGDSLNGWDNIQIMYVRFLEERNEDLSAACRKLIEYRKSNTLNFQLEKLDDFIRMIEEVL